MADREKGEYTRSVHLPNPPELRQRPLGGSVVRSAAYVFDSAQEYSDLLAGRVEGYSYARVANPTADAFAAAVAALEGVNIDREIVGEAFASGSAATTAVLMTYTRMGAHVVAARAVYGGTYALLHRVLSRFGVTVTWVDPVNLDEVRAAIRPETALIWVETIANPTTRLADLPGLAAIARSAGVPLCVDSTFASPAVCRPLEHGANLVMHSATKYLGGHSDVTGGVIVGAPELIHPVREVRIDTGGFLSPDEAYLLRRGLLTLPLRKERISASALQFATALADHPAVESVAYPGLTSHPDHELAGKLFDRSNRPDGGPRYGGIVTVTPHGGFDAGLALANGLRVALNASSLGGVHTKVSHVASSSHRQLDDAALATAGIRPGAVRFSIGLEDPDDLIADATAALDALR
ncbi:MAG: trans-sulfuration enzyme family protein [Actinomycetes bacterium]|jgi:cystathionine beta-lyase/cystathionine gamma-synthase|nr:aminotransferase class I/II-fold pyridoxal phosphate-dependent enzyme [Actinomycetes bacterium]